jgi:hypothetical protein
MYFYWVAIIMPKMPFQNNVVRNKERNNVVGIEIINVVSIKIINVVRIEIEII